MTDFTQPEDRDNSTVRKKKSILTGVFAILLLAAVPIFFLLRKQSSQTPLAEKHPVEAQSKETDVTHTNLIDLSISYLNEQKPGDAIPYLKQALQLQPKSAIAYNNLGVAYTMLKHYQLAIDACKKAIEYDSSMALAVNNLKWASLERQKVLNNINRMEVIPEDQRDSPYYIDLGVSYYRIGDYEKSISLSKKGLEADKKNTLLINNIGSSLVMMKKYDEAILMFDKALNINAADQLTKNNIIWAKLEQAQASHPQ